MSVLPSLLLCLTTLAPPPPPPPANTGSVPVAPPTSQGDAESRVKTHPAEAAPVLAAIARGEAPGEPVRAQYWLARALLELDLPASALDAFGKVVEAGPGTPYFNKTLPWLAYVARELPDPSPVLDLVGRYPPQALEDPVFDEVRPELYFLLGRYHYGVGNLEEAVALFGQVGPEAEDHVAAQYLLGVTEARRMQVQAAADAYKRVLEHVTRERAALEEKGHDLDRLDRISERLRRLELAERDDRRRRLRRRLDRKYGDVAPDIARLERNKRVEHLATVALGYMYYQGGKFRRAANYLGRIPVDSPYWLDAALGAAWSEFGLALTDPDNENVHYQRTLGHVHSIEAPFFEDRLFPEAPILRATTYYYNCRYESARAAVDAFERRYRPTQAGLRELLGSAPEDFELFEQAAAIRAKKPWMPDRQVVADPSRAPDIEDVARTLLTDRDLDKRFRQVSALQAEAERVAALPRSVRDGALGEQLVEQLDIAISMARETAGAEARRRIRQAVQDIDRLGRNALEIRYEILGRIKDQVVLHDDEKPRRPAVDGEHELYAYNGEYWRDELGFYYYRISNLCRETGATVSTSGEAGDRRRARRRARRPSDPIVVIQRQPFLKASVHPQPDHG